MSFEYSDFDGCMYVWKNSLRRRAFAVPETVVDNLDEFQCFENSSAICVMDNHCHAQFNRRTKAVINMHIHSVVDRVCVCNTYLEYDIAFTSIFPE